MIVRHICTTNFSGHDFFTGILAMDDWSIKVSRLDDDMMKSFEAKNRKRSFFFFLMI